MSTHPLNAIIDRSPQQTRRRVEKLRLELNSLGYSVVKTDWLLFVRGDVPAKPKKEKATA